MSDELIHLKQATEQASKLMSEAATLISVRKREIQIKKAEFSLALKKLETELQEINFLETQVKSTLGTAKPLLVLPKLLPDHSDVDPACRDHLDAQAKQIINIFKILSSPERPLVHSLKIKEYILANYEIENADYWMAKTSPSEPERWWKNIYDKAIERLDLFLGKIVRRNVTGKKGVYALKEYYDQKKNIQYTLFE